jgi:glycosyltransferase involved in cell wall biosynthesis
MKHVDPKLTVIILTYNHKRTIAKALESVLRQNTNFNFIINIFEDASTDDTAAICQKYKKQYPSVINLYLQEKNLGVEKNAKLALASVKGEYWTLLEGDDYWICDDKLQQQVDILDKNTDCTVCAHQTQIISDIDGYSSHAQTNFPANYQPGKVSIADLVVQHKIFLFPHTSSRVYRNVIDIVNLPPHLCYDIYILYLFMNKGNMFFINKTMSVYYAGGGIFANKKQFRKRIDMAKSLHLLNKMLAYKYSNYFALGILPSQIHKIYKIIPNSIFWRLFYLGATIAFVAIYLLSFPFSKRQKRRKKAININYSNNLDLLLIDDITPQIKGFGFRDTEFRYYLKNVKKSLLLTLNKKNSLNLGQSELEYNVNSDNYLKNYPDLKNKLLYMPHPPFTNKVKLAYMIFLNVAFACVKFLEYHNIPFVFTCYPGGGFELNNQSVTMRRLRRVTASPMFRKVIVTQTIIRDFLLNEKICRKDQIELVYGGYAQFSKQNIIPKKFYPEDKKTFDICFVAMKYMPRGINKGFDIFIEVAKRLALKMEDFHFHVVGNFDETDIDVSRIRSSITFHGVKSPKSLIEFYAGMDIFISPNIPFVFPGSFDGFPLGVDAGYAGTAMFVTDELAMNIEYTDNDDIVIIKPDPDDIVSELLQFYCNLSELYKLSRRCQITTQKVFDAEVQSQARLKIFEEITNSEVS